MIKSPYNFVPAPAKDEVFHPDWAKQVSHDIPFSDGESGEITFTITAKTPIFIRNGHSKKDHEVFERWRDEYNCDDSRLTNDEKISLDRYLSFSNYNGKYFIPATSIKGMLRNVLEILSFSKLNPNLVNDDRYSHRDLTDGSLYRNVYDSNIVRCGWLRINDDGEWLIEDLGRPARISYQDIDSKFGTNFQEQLTYKEFKNISNYQLRNKLHCFTYEEENYELPNHSFSVNKEKTKVYKKLPSKFKNAAGKYDEVKSKTNKFLNEIDVEGNQYILVMTGSPSFDKQKEFLFPSIVLETYELSKNKELATKRRKDFLFIYKDHDKDNISPDWRFWRDELKRENGKIPVFFTEENGEVLHFGLSFMYKLPYKYSIHETLTFNNQKKELDFIENLFGAVGENSFKGRIFFGAAWGKTDIIQMDLKKEILASPKASFLPFYIKQNKSKNGNYKYFSYDDIVELSGFKRYPVHTSNLDFSNTFKGKYDEKQLNNKKVFSFFKPVPSNSIFCCTIRYHNLKPIELGALLSAITFHGNSNSNCHSLGSVKPYGYGKVTLKIISITNQFGDLLNENDYMLKFEKYMCSKINSWLDSLRLKSLFTYSSGKSTIDLEYMQINDFVDLKNIEKSKQFLEPELSIQQINSIHQKFKPQEKLILLFENYEDLSKFLNKKIIEWGEFSEENKHEIETVIDQIFNGKHKDSVKKLKKEYPWKNSIPKWIGEVKAKELKKSLFDTTSNP